MLIVCDQSPLTVCQKETEEAQETAYIFFTESGTRFERKSDVFRSHWDTFSVLLGSSEEKYIIGKDRLAGQPFQIHKRHFLSSSSQWPVNSDRGPRENG